jgi:hypothetical protein
MQKFVSPRSRIVIILPILAVLAACGEPEPFSAAMPPVVLADHSVQQSAIGQVDNGCLEGKVTQIVTYHQKRGSHALKPVASGTAVTDGGCGVIIGAIGAVAAAKVGAGDINAGATAISVSEAEANAVNK